jgi:hepatocyte growth factor-regulated tyrosine kinase substrate
MPPPRQPSGPYPSLPSHQGHNQGPGAENYYTGQQQASYQAPPPGLPYQQAPPQATPQPQFASYASAPDGVSAQYPPQQPLQRTESWQSRGQSVPQDQYQQFPPPQHRQEPSQPVPNPQQASATPSADPHASYYFGNQQPSQPPAAPAATAPGPESNSSPYPNLQQSPHLQRGSLSGPSQPTPTQAMVQPSQPSQAPQPQPTMPPHQQQQPVQHSLPTQAPGQQMQQQPIQPTAPQQQPYWQQEQATPQQQQQQPPQPQQPAVAPQNWAYTGYTQNSFPSVPQNEPARSSAPEEALIEF